MSNTLDEKQKFVDAMHDYYGLVEPNDLVYWADIYDSVVQALITEAVKEGMLRQRHYDEALITEARIDEWDLLGETLHSAGIASELHINNVRESRLAQLKEKL